MIESENTDKVVIIHGALGISEDGKYQITEDSRIVWNKHKSNLPDDWWSMK